MRDLYLRDPSDPFFKQGILEVTDEIQILISQVKMLLMTNRGEVLGAPDFGANLEEQLFTLSLNEYSLRSMLNDQTLKFIPLHTKYMVDYSVKFIKGTIRDICVIDVMVNNIPAFGVVIK